MWKGAGRKNALPKVVACLRIIGSETRRWRTLTPTPPPLHKMIPKLPRCHGATSSSSSASAWDWYRPDISGRHLGWSILVDGIVRDRQGCCLKIYVIVSFFWRIFLSLPINLLLCKHDPSTDFKILHELWNSKFGFKGSLRFGIVWDISWYLFSSLRLAKEAETSVDRTMAHFGPGGSGAQLQILFLFR
jgi:hypothetical protein